MSEPQITDYYNNYPHGIYVIDKMNEELQGLQLENEKLKKEIIQYCKEFNDYKKYKELTDILREIKLNEYINKRKKKSFMNCFSP